MQSQKKSGDVTCRLANDQDINVNEPAIVSENNRANKKRKAPEPSPCKGDGAQNPITNDQPVKQIKKATPQEQKQNASKERDLKIEDKYQPRDTYRRESHRSNHRSDDSHVKNDHRRQKSHQLPVGSS
jgi:hypothetical protein